MGGLDKNSRKIKIGSVKERKFQINKYDSRFAGPCKFSFHSNLKRWRRRKQKRRKQVAAVASKTAANEEILKNQDSLPDFLSEKRNDEP